jgi:hypothetical protein
MVTNARAVISIEEITSERLIAALDAEDTPKAAYYLRHFCELLSNQISGSLMKDK